jgi:hypothetical protein
VGDETINHTIIKGYRSASVVFEATTQEDDDRRVTLGISVLASGALPHMQVLERYFKSKTPREDLIQLYAERVVAELIANGAVAQAVMRTANMEDAEAELSGRVSEAASQVGTPLPGEEAMEGFELGNRITPGGTSTLGGRGDLPIQ